MLLLPLCFVLSLLSTSLTLARGNDDFEFPPAKEDYQSTPPRIGHFNSEFSGFNTANEKEPDTPRRVGEGRTEFGAENEEATPHRVVAVGDLHGDWIATLRVLKLAKIIDKTHKWIAGNTILVQTGNIADYGDAARLIYKLFISLSKQAEESGGQVIQLLGNHELMNLQGKLHDVTYWDKVLFGGEEERKKAFSRHGWVGKYLYNAKIAAKVDDTVFFHAGASPSFAKMGVDGMNERARLELSGKSRLDPGTMSVFGATGPLYYPDYFGDNISCKKLDSALELLGAKRMVIGHKALSRKIESRCQSKLFIIDIGMSSAYSSDRKNPKSYAAALEIVQDKVHLIHEPEDLTRIHKMNRVDKAKHIANLQYVNPIFTEYWRRVNERKRQRHRVPETTE